MHRHPAVFHGQTAAVPTHIQWVAYPDNLLVRGERVLLRQHPHWKVVIRPAILGLLVSAAGIYAAMLLPRHHLWGRFGALFDLSLGLLLLLLLLTVVSIVKWRCEHFALSNEHLFTRRGIFRRAGQQIPIGRLQDIDMDQSLLGRILGYGNLSVSAASDQPLLDNIPHVVKVHQQINQLTQTNRPQPV